MAKTLNLSEPVYQMSIKRMNLDTMMSYIATTLDSHHSSQGYQYLTLYKQRQWVIKQTLESTWYMWFSSVDTKMAVTALERNIITRFLNKHNQVTPASTFVHNLPGDI